MSRTNDELMYWHNLRRNL